MAQQIPNWMTAVDAGIDDDLVGMLAGDDTPSPAPVAARAARAEGPRARVLIADDSTFIRYGLHTLLAENGYEVLEAADGMQAIELYRKARPDAVLLDITMPELDGLNALRQIRLIDMRARVAMVTGMGQQTIVMQAVRGGALDFIVKPIDPVRVLATVRKLIAA